jgi:hypothetical protein
VKPATPSTHASPSTQGFGEQSVSHVTPANPPGQAQVKLATP